MKLTKTKVGVVMAMLACASVPSALADEAGPIDDVVDCLGANSRVAYAAELVMDQHLPGSSDDGWLFEPGAQMFGLFLLDERLDGLIWYKFSGRATGWEKCEGVSIYLVDVDESTHMAASNAETVTRALMEFQRLFPTEPGPPSSSESKDGG